MKTVTVLDYGIGNLLNVVRAFEHCGATVRVVDKAPLMADGHVVLPGVGAFKDAMEEIRARGFDALIANHLASDRPFMGICVGMQVMFSASEEFGFTDGLSLIPGRVMAIPDVGANGQTHRIPLVGWRPLLPHASGVDWRESVLRKLPEAAQAYFVHSFAGNPNIAADTLAEIRYDGIPICAAVQRGNAVGCQFHPEKSAQTGLTVLATFLEM